MNNSNMKPELDQWLRSTNTSANPMDHLAALKKLTINSDGKIQWPSILASTNSSWLASSNKNLEINQPAPSTWIRTHYEKLRKEDNNKWLIDSKNNDQKQTDLLVTLTEWLHIPSSTSTESLPGKRPESMDHDVKEKAGNSNTILFGRIAKMDNQQWLHSSSSSAMMDDESLMKSSQSSSKNQDQMAGNSNLDASDHESTSVKSATNNRSACSVIFPNHSTSLDNWLSKPQCAKKNKNDLPNDLGDWLMVPGPKKQLEKNQNLLSQWNEKALHMNWNQSNSIKVEEWLKDALDDEEENNFNDDDFDESSIEIIDH